MKKATQLLEVLANSLMVLVLLSVITLPAVSFGLVNFNSEESKAEVLSTQKVRPTGELKESTSTNRGQEINDTHQQQPPQYYGY